MKKLLLLFLMVSGFAFAQPIINNPEPYKVCDDNGDGFAAFDLNIITPTLITQSGTEIAYYLTSSDAQNNIDPIITFLANNITKPFVNTIAYNQIIYIRAISTSDPTNPAFTTLNLIVNQKPFVNFTYTPGCFGTPFSFAATVSPGGDYSFSYITPQGVTNPGNVNNFTAVAEGYYSVTVTDNITGCVSFPTAVYAYFITAPVISANTTSICNGIPATVGVTYNAGNFYSCVWTVPNGVADPGNVSFFTTQNIGTYSVIATDVVTGCISNSSSVEVINQTTVDPTFTIPPSVCAAFILPALSDNSISGTWLPTVSTSGIYTFTPNVNQCASVYSFFLNVEEGATANLAPSLTQTSNTSTAVFDLTSQNNFINSDVNAQFKYYPSYTEAFSNVNEILSPTAYTNVSNPQTIGVRVFNAVSNNCDGVTYYTLEVNNVNNVYISDVNFKNRLIAMGVDTNFDNEIQFTEATAFTNEMNVSNAQIANLLGIEAFTNITVLKCNNNNLSSINFGNLTNIVDLDCSFNQISVLNLGNLMGLKTLNCSRNVLTSINFVNLNQIEDLNCSFNNLTSLNVDQLVNLKKLVCSYNSIVNLILNNIPSLERIEYAWNNSFSLTLNNLPNLKYLDCSLNFYISNLNLSLIPLLEYLDCRYNTLSTIDLTGLNNLKTLDCSINNLASLNVVGLTNLITVTANNNSISTLDLSNLPTLSTVNVNYNQLTSMNLAGSSSLVYLYCSYNQLTSLNLSGLINLYNVVCQNNQLATINFTGLPSLYLVQCDNNLLTSLDFSTAPSLTTLSCSFNNLNSINIKNGNSYIEPNTFYSWSQNPALTFVCADEEKLANLNIILNQNTNLNNGNVVFNSYCSFVPGGNFNTITGQIKLDANNNGCDELDLPQPHLKVNITDGITQGSTFTDANGNYKFYTQSGNFEMSPEIENPTWFVFSPTTATIPFPNNSNTATQNFCITPNGTHQDLEIVIAPVDFARPGMEATYKITYKNKGNITSTGILGLNFNDTLLDFVSSTQTLNDQANGILVWAVNNLQPFENRSIYVTFLVNGTNSTPPVNIGTVLNFTTNINPPTTDETPADNQFSYAQTVVDAYVTNAITCLEGDFVSETLIGEYLHYSMRFENTGNFLAENVVLKNLMDDTKFDISSLEVINTSHPVYTTVAGNLVEFIFKNINLQATVGNPPVGGHGDVLFKVRTKATLNDNDFVIQNARFYFDYKLPILTNDAVTTFGTLNSQDFQKDNSVKIYPNPTTSIVNIESSFNIQSIELYDVQGRVLETFFANANLSKIDLSSQSSGIYFLKIKTDSGSKVAKVVKK